MVMGPIVRNNNINRKSLTQFVICTEITHTYYFYNKSSSGFPEKIIYEALTQVPLSENKDQMYGFYWKKGSSKRETNLQNEIIKNEYIYGPGRTKIFK